MLFATESQIVNWIKNPKPFNETIKAKEFNCNHEVDATDTCPGGKDPIPCKYETGIYDTMVCDDKCPEEYPGIFNKVCGDGVC